MRAQIKSCFISHVEKTFVASETGNGIVEITFTVDASKLGSHHIVAFEKCTYIENGKKYDVAEHKDYNDKDQTVFVKNPAPKTGDNTSFGVVWLMVLTIALAALIAIRRKIA